MSLSIRKIPKSMPSDRLFGKHTLLHCYCRGVFYQKSSAGSLLLVPGHHHRSQHHNTTSPRHNTTTSPCHNTTTLPSIPFTTKKLHFEDNAFHYDAIALLPQRAVYIIIYLQCLISSPSPARASSAVSRVCSEMPVRTPSAAAADRATEP